VLSDPQDLGLGGSKLLVRQHALRVQLRVLLELRGLVLFHRRRRRRVLLLRVLLLFVLLLFVLLLILLIPPRGLTTLNPPRHSGCGPRDNGRTSRHSKKSHRSSSRSRSNGLTRYARFSSPRICQHRGELAPGGATRMHSGRPGHRTRGRWGPRGRRRRLQAAAGRALSLRDTPRYPPADGSALRTTWAAPTHVRLEVESFLDHGFGGRRNSLVSGRVRGSAITGGVVRLVVAVIGAFERGAHVEVRRPSGDCRRFDDGVDLVGHLLGGGD